jgi:hypothetical protein
MYIAEERQADTTDAEALLTKVNEYLGDLIAAFTGTTLEPERYKDLRTDLLRNPIYAGLAPDFLKRNRDTSALWSFAKSIDGSWEPRRVFLREQFEPLLEYLEKGALQPKRRMPNSYDSSAWAGIDNPAQRVRAVKTLVPLAQSAIDALINHLEQPSHNGGPPLDEITEALNHLRKLHSKLGEILLAADEGTLTSSRGEGLMDEAARFAKRAAKSLKEDPLPYAFSATLLAIFTACGFPGLGGYISAVAMAIKKPSVKVL